MQLKLIFYSIFFIIFMIINENASRNNNNNVDEKRIGMNKSTEIVIKGKRKSRPRRYIAFPDGASFSVAICATIGVIGNPNPAFLSYGLNWGVAYDLPNQTWIIDQLNGFRNSNYREPKAIAKRRSRRNIYKHIETGIEHMGYNGRHCILRALCESKKFFIQKGRNMIEEIIRVIFSFPNSKLYSHETKEIIEYDTAFRYANNIGNCAHRYYKCGFSLIELAFGRYSEPPPDFWDKN